MHKILNLIASCKDIMLAFFSPRRKISSKKEREIEDMQSNYLVTSRRRGFHFFIICLPEIKNITIVYTFVEPPNKQTFFTNLITFQIRQR